VYAGHWDIDEGGDEELGNDESFEGILPQGQMGVLNFNDGTKVKVCVSFENRIHLISHIRKFVSKCNVSGWTVTFVGEDFTNATIICDMEDSWNKVFFYCMNEIEEVSDVVYDKVNGLFGYALDLVSIVLE
jgi:hypothetical protein